MNQQQAEVTTERHALPISLPQLRDVARWWLFPQMEDERGRRACATLSCTIVIDLGGAGDELHHADHDFDLLPHGQLYPADEVVAAQQETLLRALHDEISNL